MIVVLAGGVGAARFLQGLVQVIPQERLTVIVNTGDDRDFYGLHVSPDLAIPGIQDALHEASGMVVAVSPIVGGAPIKGPADKLMLGLGIEVSPVGVARCYRDFLDVMVIDEQDE